MNKIFLKEYLTLQSPSGDEVLGQRCWSDEMKRINPSLRFKVNNFGNVSATDDLSENKIHVLVTAHVDEISWRISYIEDSGLIRVIRNGGSDQTVTLGSRCSITTKTKKINGVFGQIAIHLRKERTEMVDVDGLYVDVGVDSKDEVVKLGIRVGDLVCGYDEPLMLGETRLTSRALDNKIGGYILTLLAEKLKGVDLTNVRVSYGNCIQEETGLRGAKMMAETLKPDIVLVTDVCHATDSPNVSKIKTGDVKLGNGCGVPRGSLLSEDLVNTILETKNLNSPPQIIGTSESTGTDADAFSLANGGTLTCLVKTPVRYMHTQVEMCDMNDVSDVATCFASLIADINGNPSKWWLLTNQKFKL